MKRLHRRLRASTCIVAKFFQLLLACCALPPLAANAQLFRDSEEIEKSWLEAEIKLPPIPRPGALLEFEAGAASANRFYVDPESISVGGDGVVRYTLVVKGPGGGENISYEGIRCETREQKYYAFGRRDGAWSTARSSEWRRIEYKEINRQHGVLYADYLCPDRKPVKSSQDAINRFKYGVPPRGGM